MRAEGTVAPGFERVREVFEAALPEELGAGFAAVRDGEIVVNLWGGWANRDQTTPWTSETIAPVYSTTKGVSAIVLARLFDQGLIDWYLCTHCALHLSCKRTKTDRRAPDYDRRHPIVAGKCGQPDCSEKWSSALLP